MPLRPAHASFFPEFPATRPWAKGVGVLPQTEAYLTLPRFVDVPVRRHFDSVFIAEPKLAGRRLML